MKNTNEGNEKKPINFQYIRQCFFSCNSYINNWKCNSYILFNK